MVLSNEILALLDSTDWVQQRPGRWSREAHLSGGVPVSEELATNYVHGEATYERYWGVGRHKKLSGQYRGPVAAANQWLLQDLTPR